MKLAMQESLKRQRGNNPTPLELLVLIYVIGFIWEETQEIFHSGIRSYLRDMWNFIDFMRNSLYVFVFILRGVAYFQQMKQIELDPSTAFRPRETWDDFDPQLIVSWRSFWREKWGKLFKDSLIFFLHSMCHEPKRFLNHWNNVWFFGSRLKVFLLLQTSSQLLNSSICSQLILIWDHCKFLLVEWSSILWSFSSSTHWFCLPLLVVRKTFENSRELFFLKHIKFCDSNKLWNIYNFSGLNQLLWYYADLERAKCYSLPQGLPDWNNEGDACMKFRRFFKWGSIESIWNFEINLEDKGLFKKDVFGFLGFLTPSPLPPVQNFVWSFWSFWVWEKFIWIVQNALPSPSPRNSDVFYNSP